MMTSRQRNTSADDKLHTLFKCLAGFCILECRRVFSVYVRSTAVYQ